MITDCEAYKLIRAGDILKGWEILFRKYYGDGKTNPYLKSFLNKYQSSIPTEDLKVTWEDSIELLCIAIQKGTFTPNDKSETSENCLLKGIWGFAYNKVRNLWRKKRPGLPLPPELVTDEENEASEINFDYLMARISVEKIDDPWRTILLLKYFAETPEAEKKTDKELCQILNIRYPGEHWTTAEFGVYRRRAIAKMMQHYGKLNKSAVETAVNEHDKTNFYLLNLHFPTSTLYGILLNQGKKYPEDQRKDQLLQYLEETHQAQEPETNDRLRTYPAQVSQWMKLLEKDLNISDVEYILLRFSALMQSFASRFFNPKLPDIVK